MRKTIAVQDDQLPELEAAAVAARRRIDALWRAAHPDWLAIEHAVDDLSAAVGLIVADHGLARPDDAQVA